MLLLSSYIPPEESTTYIEKPVTAVGLGGFKMEFDVKLTYPEVSELNPPYTVKTKLL